ncbi:NAD(P)-dependent oxidoreductase [Psittacicella hinzii]|uniref:NAD(P)-binding domain-containing protein n=1 Tax=Psittacicella hinzii TaxID=2028575 RepID=A0A3A1YM36_9GAMM|nr:NAD(P)H-binding protein [Psittacicella hinzii]RIY38725.1 hypothetical protein CKF58_03570 [Psittacicella hinzii]
MKVLVLASNGQTGSLVAQELVALGHQVTGLGRGDNRNSFLTSYLQQDLLDLTAEQVKDFDAVVSAFGVLNPELFPMYKQVATHLTSILANSDTKLYVVGGAGSLVVDPASGARLFDTPDFPADYQGLARAHAEQLLVVRQSATNWVYVHPAADFDENGAKTGNVVIGGADFAVNKAGESYISYADYAHELASLVSANKFSRVQLSFRQGDAK